MCARARETNDYRLVLFMYAQLDAVSYDDYVDAPDVEAASMDEHIAEVLGIATGWGSGGIWTVH